VTLNGSGADLGHVPVFAWFGRQEHNVFLDANGNGVRDEGEVGLPEQNVNIRFRDGSIFQSFPTDTEGFVPFDEMFPFFSWLVAEVDFARFKATGLTVTVDGGGDTSASPYPGLLSVQEGSPRTETGPVLTEAFQQFASQTTLMDWGKAPYAVGENGGISGIVYYASTRAELNPRLAVGDPWERGLPGVTVRLYKEVTTAAGGTALTLVDETTTDSWDDSLPEGCLGEDETSPFVTASLGTDNLKRCYDGWRNYNQARPGIFDGGYAFGDIPPGDYIVEVVPPEGYELVKEEDTNVGYGDVFEMAPVAVTLPGGATVVVVPDVATILDSTAEPGLAQPPCVGVEREVPELESLFPDTATLSPFAGYVRPLCDRKAVHLSDQGQSAADFFLYTPAPIATQFTGLILDDVAMEHDQTSPNYSEKWAPSFLPVSIRDHLGNEVFHTYSDGYGRYNGLAASTYTANIPNPSGYSPAMYAVCLNSAGTASRPEPYRNENYGEIATPCSSCPAPRPTSTRRCCRARPSRRATTRSTAPSPRAAPRSTRSTVSSPRVATRSRSPRGAWSRCPIRPGAAPRPARPMTRPSSRGTTALAPTRAGSPSTAPAWPSRAGPTARSPSGSRAASRRAPTSSRWSTRPA